MFVNYLKARFSIVKFLLLAMLLSMLVLKRVDPFINWFTGILFLFISFLVFRLLDDAGSVYYDREHHPDRNYLDAANYPSFLKLTGLVTISYLISLAFCSLWVAAIICSLIVLSICLYFIFNKNNVILPIIPLLKYPVLLGCISLFSLETTSVLVLLSSFFIMASYDSLDTLDNKSSNLWKSMFLLLLCGILIFQPWENAFNWFFVLAILIFLPFTKQMKNFRLAPILYYPIIAFALNTP